MRSRITVTDPFGAWLGGKVTENHKRLTECFGLGMRSWLSPNEYRHITHCEFYFLFEGDKNYVKIEDK